MIVWGGEGTNAGGIYQPPLPEFGLSTGTITVSAPGASNAPQTITVGLNVTP